MTDLARCALDIVRGEGPPIPASMTFRQIALLGVICDAAAPMKVRVLADRLGICKPVVTRANSRLGKLGFVQVRVDPTDRRDRIISPTATGRAARQALQVTS